MLSETLRSPPGSHIPPTLTIWEILHKYLTAPLRVARALFGLFKDLITLKIRSSITLKRALFKHLAWSNKILSLRQTRSAQPPTSVTVATTCAANNLSHTSVEVSVPNYPPANLHFINCQPSDPGDIILFLHGGGYFQPMSASHLNFARLAANAAHTNLAMLEYTLAPESAYPGQLAQCVAALQFLLRHRDPAEIIVGGESAGGNLALGMLAHLSKPHPEIPAVDLGGNDEEGEVESGLRGVFCISPRCSNVVSAESFTTNAAKDIVGAKSIEVINDRWKPDITHVWATPLEGSAQFWDGMKVQNLILTAGGDECYRDDIIEFAGVVGAKQGDVNAKRAFFVCDGEFHAQCVLDVGMGVKEGIMMRVMMEWFRSL